MEKLNPEATILSTSDEKTWQDFIPVLLEQNGDGFGDPTVSSTSACEVAEGFVFNATDCDDNNPSIYPSAEEICDGIPYATDCNDNLSNDADCDGVPTEVDCDDGDLNVGNLSIDHDCDGQTTWVDCDDNDNSDLPRNIDQNCDDVPDMILELGGLQSCVVNNNQSIYCIGNVFGNRSPYSDLTFYTISVGETIGCGIDSEYLLQCWGSDDIPDPAISNIFQIGILYFQQYSTPVITPPIGPP